MSVFLFAYLDWNNLLKCDSEDTCHATLGDYIYDHPLNKSSLWTLVIKIYILLFFTYGCISIVSFVTTLIDAIEAKDFYENELGISARRLGAGAIQWDEIVHKIVNLHSSGEYRVSLPRQSKISALTIAQRILRKENWLVAFLNCRILDLRVPLPPFFHSAGNRSKFQYLSTTLEWSIYLCIFGFMYNHNYRVRPSFIDKPESLQRRFVLCGIVHAILTPFLLIFMILHFFFVNMYDWRSTKNYMGPRVWSNIAR